MLVLNMEARIKVLLEDKDRMAKQYVYSIHNIIYTFMML